MIGSRRQFLHTAAAAAAFSGLSRFAHAQITTGSDGYSNPGYANQVTGYGPLKPDPAEIFDLPEGFSYRVISKAGDRMDDGLIAITDERQHSLYILRLLPDSRELRIDQALQRVDLGYADDANKGFEGLAWDRANQRFLLGKEKRPIALFSLATDGQKVTGELQELRDLGGIITDLAGLTVDPRSAHVLVLSQESHLLVELNKDYQPSNYIALLRGLHGLQHFIPQAEGVALDADGNLYIISERNLFYVFKKQPAAE